MTTPPILAFAPHPWDEAQWMNRQHLLSRLAQRGWTIVYSPGALDVWQRRSAGWQSARNRGAIERMDGVLVDRPGRWMPRWRASPVWDRVAVQQHNRRLLRAVGARSGSDVIALLFHPGFWPYAEALRPRHLTAHVYDVYAQIPGWSSDLATMLERVVERADVLTASAETMARRLPGPGPDRARILPNGADVAAFCNGTDRPCPSDLEGIPRPRIAYCGSLNQKVDFATIAAVALARPDWHWVLIGGLSEDVLAKDKVLGQALMKCRGAANVHFLGEKRTRDIPAYVSRMDVNSMIYRTDGQQWFRFGYPLKLHEYLAAGRPVVSVPLETVRPFHDVLDMAGTPAEWVAAIERALAHGGVGTVEQRRAVAHENTWDRRADVLDGWYREMAGATLGP